MRVRVRCADCQHVVSPALTWRGEVFAGWVQCGLAVEPEDKARYLSPDYARVCALFVAVAP